MKNISITRLVLIVLMLFVTNVFAFNNEDYNKAKNMTPAQLNNAIQMKHLSKVPLVLQSSRKCLQVSWKRRRSR